jgi:hypothetical protein
MTSRSPIEAYTALQRLARQQQRGNTQQLLELHVLERFLARLSVSPYADRFVLKGGMLLATLGARRPTRDADILALRIDNAEETVRTVVAEIAAIDMADGVTFGSETTTRVIREEADYHGVRVTTPASVGSARLKLALDVSFGDPVEPQAIVYPTLLDDPAFELLGYPIESVIAEKAETMMARGDANTRDRDFGDVLALSRVHAVEAAALREAIRRVAAHRGRELVPLRESITTLGESRQTSWRAFRERAGLPALPERFADVVEAVSAFIDPLLGETDIVRWNPADQAWE